MKIIGRFAQNYKKIESENYKRSAPRGAEICQICQIKQNMIKEILIDLKDFSAKQTKKDFLTLTWQNPGQLFVAQELIKKVELKCCGI